MNESEYMKEARRLVDALHRACTFGRCEEAEAALLSHIAKGEQARAAHPSGGGEAGWRPIETAPKHEEVLAWREDAGAMLSIYTTCADSGWLSDKEQDEMDEDTLWKEDWWWFGPHGVCRMEGREVPTHWMPLPADPDASPTTAGQQAGGGEDGKHCQVQVIHLTDQQREMLSAKGVTHIPGRADSAAGTGLSAAIDCTSAAGRCDLCKGTGIADLPDRWGGVTGTCPDCNGTGGVGAAAPAQREAAPVEFWTLLHEWRDTADTERADAIEHRFGELFALARNAGVPAAASAAQEPIPDRVYWAPLADNFYDADGKGQGLEFYRKWKPRRAEFPQGESHGWGPGSAHNPFKDAPRNAGVGAQSHEVSPPADADAPIPAEVGRRALEALEHITRRLQMDIDDGSRPDQWSMEDLVRKAAHAITELQQALEKTK